MVQEQGRKLLSVVAPDPTPQTTHVVGEGSKKSSSNSLYLLRYLKVHRYGRKSLEVVVGSRFPVAPTRALTTDASRCAGSKTTSAFPPSCFLSTPTIVIEWPAVSKPQFQLETSDPTLVLEVDWSCLCTIDFLFELLIRLLFEIVKSRIK
jgi:hypothetical protein